MERRNQKQEKEITNGLARNRPEEDCAYDITDLADLSLYDFYRLYQQLAIHGHLLDLEQTVCNQKPIFADEDWKIAKLVDRIEKE